MKLTDHFNELLVGTVNLSESRLGSLESRISSIYATLCDDDELKALIQGQTPAGSWSQRTIINPPAGKEFDGDVLVQFADNPEWASTPKAYIEQIYAALNRSSTYRDKAKRKCRCVRVTYANDFHVDIVPYVVRAGGKFIVNRDKDTWERTDPEGFTEWMKRQDSTANGNLRRIVRLMKYLRDHRSNFTGTRSIILTTLLGERVETSKTVFDPGYYSGLPTALLHVVSDLDDWLQRHLTMPPIYDPAGTGLTFNHRWDDVSYQHFSARIASYAEKMQAAYDEPDKGTSVALWQDIFGSGFRAPQRAVGSGRFGVPPVLPTRSGRAG